MLGLRLCPYRVIQIQKKEFNSSPILYNLERAIQEMEVQWDVSQHDKQFSVKQNREDSKQKAAKLHV